MENDFKCKSIFDNYSINFMLVLIMGISIQLINKLQIIDITEVVALLSILFGFVLIFVSLFIVEESKLKSLKWIIELMIEGRLRKLSNPDRGNIGELNIADDNTVEKNELLTHDN